MFVSEFKDFWFLRTRHKRYHLMASDKKVAVALVLQRECGVRRLDAEAGLL